MDTSKEFLNYNSLKSLYCEYFYTGKNLDEKSTKSNLSFIITCLNELEETGEVEDTSRLPKIWKLHCMGFQEINNLLHAISRDYFFPVFR